MGYFGRGERHWYQQPLCALKAQAGTHTKMHFRLLRASRSGKNSVSWLVFTAGDFWGLKFWQISIMGVDSYV